MEKPIWSKISCTGIRVTDMMLELFVGSPLFKNLSILDLLTDFPHSPDESDLLPPTAAHLNLKLDSQDLVFMTSFRLLQPFAPTYFRKPTFKQASSVRDDPAALQDLSTDVATCSLAP